MILNIAPSYLLEVRAQAAGRGRVARFVASRRTLEECHHIRFRAVTLPCTMATVYLAQDLKHDRKVAIKVLRPELGAVIGAERFLREIKTTANLQHPHILPLIDSGEVTALLYYVMPYVEGETLRDRLNREKQLPIDDAVRIATEVADALDYAHRHGVDPPRHQAREHPAARRPRAGRRLRHRARGASRPAAAA